MSKGERQKKVADLRRKGMTIKAIAETVGASAPTVAKDLKQMRAHGYDLGEKDDPNEPQTAELPTKQLTGFDTERLRTVILERQLMGYTVDQIAAAFNLTRKVVNEHLTASYAAIANPKAELLRTRNLARLERLLTMLEPAMQQGDTRAIATAARIIGQHNDIGGGRLPVQVEHTMITVDMIDAEIERLTEEMRQAEATIDGELVPE